MGSWLKTPLLPTRPRTSSAPVMYHHTACCPCLNSTAQPWPLPGCNQSPGTAMFNSPLTTKSLSHFLMGLGHTDETHLPFQGTENMFTTTREAIDWHIRAVLLKVSRHSFTAREGVEARDLIQVQGSQVSGEDGHEIPAGPRGEQVQSWQQLPAPLTFIQWFCVYKYLIFLSATLWFPRSYWVS